ncbi:MAG: 50S ribosome-binding GTPase [Phycisphaerae bacterium]|nr:50S ribosome-binding GTPase [Phycisphaerae bacterium]
MTDPADTLAADPDCFAILSSPRGPGAIAVIDLIGDVRAGLARLYPTSTPAPATVSHRRFGDFDDGVVALLSEDRAQLCPHGGPRVVERLRDWLAAHQIGWLEDASAIDPQEVFPEAGDRIEAFALAALTRAASPRAVPLLLEQSTVWRLEQPSEADRPRSARLRRLLVPPRVVVVGSPNVGKSTLSNALAGRTVAIASDAPGTTRDYVAARVNLDGLVVDWFDTPGLRDTEDPIEREAISLAKAIIDGADLVVAAAEPGGSWPDVGRVPDLRLLTKSDLAASHPPPSPPSDIAVSATTGAGIAEFAVRIRELLVPTEDLESPRPWIFDDRLLSPA